MARRNLAKQRRKYRARRIIQSLQKKKNLNEVFSTLYCENEKKEQKRNWKGILEVNIRMKG